MHLRGTTQSNTHALFACYLHKFVKLPVTVTDNAYVNEELVDMPAASFPCSYYIKVVHMQYCRMNFKLPDLLNSFIFLSQNKFLQLG